MTRIEHAIELLLIDSLAVRGRGEFPFYSEAYLRRLDRDDREHAPQGEPVCGLDGTEFDAPGADPEAAPDHEPTGAVLPARQCRPGRQRLAGATPSLPGNRRGRRNTYCSRRPRAIIPR